MNTQVATTRNQPPAMALESVLIEGDLSALTAPQRIAYYKAVCESVGLNPLTKPFDYLKLNGRLVLYAKRDCTDQLRRIYGVSVKLAGRETIEGVYVVSAQATDRDGRCDESTGAVNIATLKGEFLANAMMKAETKAKRRVTLSICGLGMMDESEAPELPSEPPPPRPTREQFTRQPIKPDPTADFAGNNDKRSTAGTGGSVEDAPPAAEHDEDGVVLAIPVPLDGDAPDWPTWCVTFRQAMTEAEDEDALVAIWEANKSPMGTLALGSDALKRNYGKLQTAFSSRRLALQQQAAAQAQGA